MKLTGFKSLLLISLVSLGGLILGWPDHPGQGHFRHGLRVAIDPDTGEFQRPEVPLEQVSPVASLLAMVKQPTVSAIPGEVQSRQAGGGFTVNLEQHYRPSRHHKAASGS